MIAPLSARTHRTEQSRSGTDVWQNFADSFTRDHDGWSASLRIRLTDGALETEIDERPFRGLTFESRGGHESLILMFGDEPDEHLAHFVDRPCELALPVSDRVHCSLVVELDDGSGYLLELENPMAEDDSPFTR